MGKLWDALKKADRESGADYVKDYENSFENPPEEYAGNLDLNLTPNMAEEYRKLVRKLRNMGEEQGKALKLVLVAGSSFGEGATTIAASLAAGLASDWKSSKILLMDLNLRNPAIHNLFDTRPAPGMVEVVADFEHRMEFFRASPVRLVPNLHIITAGNIDLIDTSPLEILEHELLHKFLQEIRGFYEMVIIDCAPVNPFSDVASLSPHVDGVLLVVDADSTRWEVAQQARDQLTMAKANILGVILNKRKLAIPGVVYRRL